MLVRSPSWDDIDAVDREPPAKIREVVRYQTIDSKAIDAVSMHHKLLLTKYKADGAAFWQRASVGLLDVIEKDGDDAVMYQKRVIVCDKCCTKHGEKGKTLNPNNWASTHFSNHKTKPECKRTGHDGSYICFLSRVAHLTALHIFCSCASYHILCS